MWWRLIALSGMFFFVSRIIREDHPRFHGTCAVVHNRANGHYYQWIPMHGVEFDKALSWSKDCRFAGAKGHLATITSQQENDFLGNHRGMIGSAWIAATDRDQEGVWKWVAGDEAGDVFFTVGEAPDKYGFHHWAENEPNDHNEEEDFAVFGWVSESNWNDLADRSGRVDGFLVEYAGLPEPDKLVVTSRNTHSPFFGGERPSIIGEKHGQSWQW
jgi:hypothetical protein